MKMKVKKISNCRRVLRSIFGPLTLMICTAGLFAAMIYGYTEFQLQSEQKPEQKEYEGLLVNVHLEKDRLKTAATSSQTYSSKYAFTKSDTYGIILGFLNGTLLTISEYQFKWSKILVFSRLYDHALLLTDDLNIPFFRPTTQLINTLFRLILPIFTSFAVGTSVSAIQSIVEMVLGIFLNHKKYDAWTVGRNKMLRAKVTVSMVLAVVYFVLSFFLTSFAASRWQDVSFGDGVKITINLMTTIIPNVRLNSVTDAHTLAALFFLIHTATSFVIFSLIKLSKTLRLSKFTVPTISEIDQADQMDRQTQLEYREKRSALSQNDDGNVAKKIE